ncbi:hypothetical protein H2204_005880 [Knufia peltigerae]|uniref:Cytochrome P450 n=1 Tax=Knufia peltigerae TaxID=1002370 RepID=A0AA39CY49_9EURO|nr:hypothetical protein H2204_005880 [Knufia peltigerae]
MAAQWEPWQTFQCMRMVESLMKQPERYVYWFDRYATLVSLKEIYGKIVDTPEDEEYHTMAISDRMHNIERLGTPGGYLVEIIPALLKLTAWMAPFRREAQELRNIELAYFTKLIGEAKQRWNSKVPESPDSFARCWLKHDNGWELELPDITYVLATLYGGGSGTTSNAMQTFVMTMALYPEWQTKLQEELDSIVGLDRLPSFADLPQLILVRAVAKEILRWRPVVPGSKTITYFSRFGMVANFSDLPHRLTIDDEYNGYHMPKGSFVHGNQWAIHRDGGLYPDGKTFNPNRYLEESWPTYKEPIEIHPNIKRFSAFGFGRRICPGLETADRSLIIQIATLAWTCNISKKLGPDGQVVLIDDMDYAEGSNVIPKPFQFELKPRSENCARMISEAVNAPY